MHSRSTDIVAAARSWLGVKWRHQGRTRRGIDCAGLVVLVGRELGIATYDCTTYGRHALGYDFLRHFAAGMTRIPLEAVAPGDVLVFKDPAAGAYPCHCGIVSDAQHMIHAFARWRRVVEDDRARWTAHQVGGFRYREAA